MRGAGGESLVALMASRWRRVACGVAMRGVDDVAGGVAMRGAMRGTGGVSLMALVACR